VSGNRVIGDTNHPIYNLGPAGKQKAQLKWETQHPRAHELLGQRLVNQQGCALGHAPRHKRACSTKEDPIVKYRDVANGACG
jgi:hypothetical protein